MPRGVIEKPAHNARTRSAVDIAVLKRLGPINRYGNRAAKQWSRVGHVHKDEPLRKHVHPHFAVCGKLPDADIWLTRLQALTKAIEHMQLAPTAHDNVASGQIPHCQGLATSKRMVNSLLDQR